MNLCCIVYVCMDECVRALSWLPPFRGITAWYIDKKKFYCQIHEYSRKEYILIKVDAL